MFVIPGRQLWDWHQLAQKKAIANDIDPSEVDWLLQTFTNLSSLSLRLGSWSQDVASKKSLPELEQLWKSRLQKRFPVQYLAETVFWRRFQLKVTPAVLIPRPETELIIDLAQSAVAKRKFTPEPQLEQHQETHWVDLGTGSGAIALGLADIFPQAAIHAVDLSQAALDIAKENAIALNLAANISFYQGRWWSPLESLQGQVTGMVANPPYIPSAQISHLQPEVTNHEPTLALDGGQDGLDDIRHLVATAPKYLISGGVWLIELMIGQSDLVVELLQRQGQYSNIEAIADLNGIERFVLAFRR